MDKIQKFLITAGRKDLAQEYYNKIALVVGDDDQEDIGIEDEKEVTEKFKKLVREKVISKEDIMDLKIMLETSPSVEDFLRKISKLFIKFCK